MQTTDENQATHTAYTIKHNKETGRTSATLQLNRMPYVPLQFRQYENHGLLDTKAIGNANSENEVRRILSAHPAALLDE